MSFSSIFFLIFLIFNNSSGNSDQIQQQLDNISEQLNRVELQLNNSVIELLYKINESNYNIMNLIKSSHALPTKNNTQSINALIIIDVQNDFINGSIALKNAPSKQDGEEVIPVINSLIDSIKFDVVVYSLDWHPANHISFFDNLSLRSHLLSNDSTPLNELKLYSTATFSINGLDNMEQNLWPRHCVQNTFGAQLHPDLKNLNENNTGNASVINIFKGTKPDIDSYSAFWDNFKLSETKLNDQLKANNVNQIFVVGLATDWCVYFTAMHGLEYGYKTFIIEDACRGVDEDLIKNRLNGFKEQNGHLIQSKQVKDYIK